MKSSTAREGTLPLFRRSITVLMAARGCNSMSALTTPRAPKARASAMSLRLPTKEPRMLMQLATTSNSGVGKSPGGIPTSTQLPHLRVVLTPCLKAGKDGAVINTPCAPPSVIFLTCPTTSDKRALAVLSAPKRFAFCVLRARACHHPRQQRTPTGPSLWHTAPRDGRVRPRRKPPPTALVWPGSLSNLCKT